MGPSRVEPAEEIVGWQEYRAFLVCFGLCGGQSWCWSTWFAWPEADCQHAWQNHGRPLFQVWFFVVQSYWTPKLFLYWYKEWWDHCVEAGPKKRAAELFEEAHPMLETLAWSDSELKSFVLQLTKFWKVYDQSRFLPNRFRVKVEQHWW